MYFNKNNKLFLLYFFIIIELTYSMLRGPMPQTKEKEGRPQFWSFNQRPSLSTTTEKIRLDEFAFNVLKHFY